MGPGMYLWDIYTPEGERIGQVTNLKDARLIIDTEEKEQVQ